MFLSSSWISPAGLPLARQTSKAARFLGGKVAVSRASRQFMGVSAGLFDGIGSWLSGSTDKKEGKNDSVLKFARNAKAGCPLAPKQAPEGLEIATFAGGCFWGLELAFQRVVGVTNTSVGYTGGPDPAPTYEKVCSGRTGHTEAVQVYYNPSECSYEALLQEFFSKVDPTTLNRQGNDRGTQYRSGIYYHNEEQKKLAEQWIEKVNAELASGSGQLYGRTVWGDKVVAELEPAGDYYLAEKYHQQYLSRGGRFGLGQSAEKGCKDPIRCYG